MTFSELLFSTFEALNRFDYDNYPVCFEAFRKKAAPFFEGVQGLDESEIFNRGTQLLAELAESCSTLPRREQNKVLPQTRQVLALFFTPAAEKHSGDAQILALAIQSGWGQRFPKYQYLPGSYEKIMEGFATNRMGLPLLKVRRRQR